MKCPSLKRLMFLNKMTVNDYMSPVIVKNKISNHTCRTNVVTINIDVLE